MHLAVEHLTSYLTFVFQSVSKTYRSAKLDATSVSLDMHIVWISAYLWGIQKKRERGREKEILSRWNSLDEAVAGLTYHFAWYDCGRVSRNRNSVMWDSLDGWVTRRPRWQRDTSERPFWNHSETCKYHYIKMQTMWDTTRHDATLDSFWLAVDNVQPVGNGNGIEYIIRGRSNTAPRRRRADNVGRQNYKFIRRYWQSEELNQ